MQDDIEYLQIESDDDSIQIIESSEDEEFITESQKNARQRLFDTIEKISIKNNYKNMYKKFANFPSASKKTITTNALAILISTILFCVCIFFIKYREPLLFVIYPVFVIYFGLSTFLIFYRLKNALFITFTGKITESFTVGTKVTNDKHFVIKLLSDDGKELCFHYYDKKQLNFDQYITLFIQENTKIEITNYGPTVNQYIEVVPTSELDARLELFDSQDENGEMTVENYINQ